MNEKKTWMKKTVYLHMLSEPRAKAARKISAKILFFVLTYVI